MSVPKKAYLWALQNPHITCVNSDMTNAGLVRDNLPLAGMKVKLVPSRTRIGSNICAGSDAVFSCFTARERNIAD
jgi:hypothetical protein